MASELDDLYDEQEDDAESAVVLKDDADDAPDGAESDTVAHTEDKKVVVKNSEKGEDGLAKVVSKLSPKELALVDFPAEWRESLIASAAEIGVKADDDVGWFLVRAFMTAYASAAAAVKSADAVDENISKIPAIILKGAVSASDELKNTIKSEMSDQTMISGKALVRAISETSNIGASAIKAASADLIKSLDSVIEQKKNEGLQTFADAAAKTAMLTTKAVVARSRAVSLLLSFCIVIGSACAGAYVEHVLTQHSNQTYLSRQLLSN